MWPKEYKHSDNSSLALRTQGSCGPHSLNFAGFLIGRVELAQSKGSYQAQWETLASKSCLVRGRRAEASDGTEKKCCPGNSVCSLTTSQCGFTEVLPRRTVRQEASPWLMGGGTRQEARWAYVPLLVAERKRGKQTWSSGHGKSLNHRDEVP